MSTERSDSTPHKSRKQPKAYDGHRANFWDGIVEYVFPKHKDPEAVIFPLSKYLDSIGEENAQVFEPTGKSHYLIQEASKNLNSQHIETTALYLQTESSLLNRVTVQICQHLVDAYRKKLIEQGRLTGKKLVENSLPYFELAVGEGKDNTQLQTNLDADTLLNRIQSYVQELFEKNNLWEKGAKEIWSNLLSWAVEEMRVEMEDSVFNSLDQEAFNQALYYQLFEQESAPIQGRITFLEEFYSQSISRRIIQDLDLPNYPSFGLETLLGITHGAGKKPTPVTEIHLSKIDTIAPIPTGLPIVSSISAQLQTDLWKPDSSGIAHFRYHSKNNLKNFLEHYITSPGDIEALPWEAAEQIINKFGFNTVKLQFIFAAHAMRQTRPWESTFTLKATDVVEELGWTKDHRSSLPEKRNEIASIAYALSCLLVKAVWIEGRGREQVDASTPVGRMWEVLIDPHGQFDWTTGRIDKPDEVYITVRPGLWTAHFLNQAGSKAKEALYQFGYLALNILKLDHYHDELTLRLAIHLTLDVRIRARDRNPHEYRVKSLLEAVIPETVIQEARQNSEKARSLFKRWNRALQLLASLGWQPALKPSETEFSSETIFYLEPYPQWLEPETQLKKPRGWVHQWLEQKLMIRPPDPISERMAPLTSSKKQPRKKLKSTIKRGLTGMQVKESRKQKGWTQAKLAGTLDVHQSLIAKIESGTRPITDELEVALRRVLDIEP